MPPCTQLCETLDSLGMTLSLVPLGSTRNLGQAKVRPGPGKILDKRWLLFSSCKVVGRGGERVLPMSQNDN